MQSTEGDSTEDVFLNANYSHLYPQFRVVADILRILTMSLKKMVTSQGSTSSSMAAETAHPS